MPWTWTTPPQQNKHTLKAQKLDRKAAKAAGKGKRYKADRLTGRADKKAAKGGWF